MAVFFCHHWSKSSCVGLISVSAAWECRQAAWRSVADHLLLWPLSILASSSQPWGESNSSPEEGEVPLALKEAEVCHSLRRPPWSISWSSLLGQGSQEGGSGPASCITREEWLPGPISFSLLASHNTGQGHTLITFIGRAVAGSLTLLVLLDPSILLGWFKGLS